MAKALSTVGKVAGVIASVASFIPPLQPIAAIAAGVALVANTGAAIIGTPKPPIMGSITAITIGANQPSPYMIGDTYSGGKMAHRTGYGPTLNKVPNPYYAMSVIHSVGGPIASIDQYLADFEPVTFTGAGWASGYYNEILYRQSSLGPPLQGAALSGPFGAIPGWGSDAKLSGKAHTLWSLKWDSKNGKFQGGAPQLGIRGRGVLTWDPRKDSSRPGGSGPQRWADPKDRAAFDAAKATWAYSNRPGLHALRYALGTWERDLNNPSSDYVLTFGIGMPLDGIVVEDFIDLENICEANDWTVSGVIEEPGDKAANLKRILTAGGAEICWKGGRLGLKLTVPWLSLDTITRDDIAEGAFDVPGAVAWRDRINTGVPQFRSPDHQWQVIDGAKISVPAFVAEDGEEKPRPVPLELVTDPAQAAELTAYEIWNAREQGPVALPIKPRLREYDGGDRLTLAEDLRAELGLKHPQVVVVAKRFDPVSMTGTLTIVTEDAAKHAAVIGTSTVFPPPTAPAQGPEYDATTSLFGRDAYSVVLSSEAIVLPADPAGNVLSYADAQTTIKVLRGPDDVTSEFALVTIDNPRDLTVTGAYPSFAVTGGLDPTEATAGLTFHLVGSGVNAGVELMKTLTLGRARDGAPGEPGLNGTNGINGTNGTDGATSFVHFAFANSANGTVDFTTGAAEGRFYVGVYTDFNPADSTNPASYTWSLFRGADGTDGIPGAPGENGQTTYVHIAYANSADGVADFTTGAPGGRTYIGLRTDFVVADSGNPADYSWSLIKGADGNDGAPGAPGADGANGADALSPSPSPPTHTVSCDFGGTPKPGQGSKSSVMNVVAGTTNVTGAATFAIKSTSGCGASMSGATLSMNAFSADSGYAEVTISYGGASIDQRVTFSKARDGAPGNSNSASISVSASTSWTDSSSVVSLAVQGAGTVNASASWLSASPNNTVSGGVRILYRLGGTSTWSVLVEAENGVPAQEPFDVFANASFGTSAAGVYEFMVQTYRSGPHGAITPGRLNVSWQP